MDYLDIDLPESALTKQRILMLDILANNDWKRPIYFSGGSFDKAEYLWLKDYLQLDGLVYKLVPIKTENQSPFEMGRIDTDLMYRIVNTWEWGNSSDLDIYHDPQTRSQGLSFRSNLARLSEQLIEEGKIDKAKDIIDMAMTQMPFERFGFYTFVEPFFDGYYKVGEQQKARELFEKLKKVYQERLSYYAGIPRDEQYSKIEDILTNLEAYQRIVFILSDNKDLEFSEKESLILKEYIGLFDDFVDDSDDYYEEPIGGPDPDLLDSVPLDTIPEATDSTPVDQAP